jgi:hypothetical protein
LRESAIIGSASDRNLFRQITAKPKNPNGNRKPYHVKKGNNGYCKPKADWVLLPFNKASAQRNFSCPNACEYARSYYKGNDEQWDSGPVASMHVADFNLRLPPTPKFPRVANDNNFNPITQQKKKPRMYIQSYLHISGKSLG